MDEFLRRQEAIVALARSEGRDLTEDERQEFDTLQRKIDDARTARAGQPPEGEPGEPTEVTPAVRQQAIQEERVRTAEILGICQHFGLPPAEHIRSGATVDRVREDVIRHLQETGAPLNVSVQRDEADKYRSAAVDALLMRGGLTVEKPAPGATEMRHMSLRDLAIESLEREGETGLQRMSKDELFTMLSRQFFNPTAAFPAILDDAINKSYATGYQSVPATFDIWTSEGSLSDFKATKSDYLAGPAGDFKLVPEGGELKHDTPVDAKLPQRKLETYGRQFTMSRQAFINDDIGFLTTVPSRYAAAGRRTINKQVYSILFNNPAIYDGTPLFSTGHRNLIATGTDVNAEAIQRMYLLMQTQRDQFDEAITLTPAFLVVPVGYGFAVRTILGSPTINTPGNTQAVNPLYNAPLTVVEEGLLNSLAGNNAIPWFLVADKNQARSIQVDYLNGQKIPTIRRMETPGQLGFVWDIYHDWGVTVVDFRGIAKNPGVPLSINP
ncbi:MAG: hypothetical protein FWE08_06140 [Oscillospiraceae bacterium]|nr:hypothetical protein [Oscillospiraceae bacterium]